MWVGLVGLVRDVKCMVHVRMVWSDDHARTAWFHTCMLCVTNSSPAGYFLISLAAGDTD